MLKPIHYHILIALADGECHGYAVMQAIRRHNPVVRCASRPHRSHRHLAMLIDEGLGAAIG